MKKIIPDDFWNCIKDLFVKNSDKPGRPPINPRKALSGIMFVLENGIKRRYVPRIHGKPSTIHGTFMRWVRNGLFEAIMQRARSFYLSKTGTLPKWCAIDSSSSKSPYANWSGKNPTDRGKRGIKKNIIIDWHGAPLAVSVGAANRHDSTFFDETLEGLDMFDESELGLIAADSAYDAKRCRKSARKKNFVLFASTNKRRNKELRKSEARIALES